MLDHKNTSMLKEDTVNSQEEKEILQKIYNSLSNAGYIRANFSGLTPFDKIAGGLMWCITGSDNLMNIGFLFGYGEELNIRKKILLSERIINALLRTTKRCPLIPQPHQIMGLDVEKIIIVVQWLLGQNYKFGITYNFSSLVDNFLTLKSDQNLSGNFLSTKNILSIEKKYQPLRKYRQKVPHVSPDNFERSHCEYVNVTCKRNQIHVDDDEIDNYVKNHLTNIYLIDFDLSEQELDDNELRQSHYDMLNEELYIPPILQDKMVALKEKERYEIILDTLQKEYSTLTDEVSQDLRHLEDIRNMNQNSSFELLSDKKFLQQHSENSQEVLNMVNETKNIRDEYSSLRVKFIEKQKKNEEETKYISEEDFAKQLKYIDELHAKIVNVEEKLAEQDKEISELEVLLDQPGPAELAMYQKRFYELYDQIAANTIETKQFYDLHNTLIDSKHYIEKEINLLNSVLDNYPRAMSSANFREQFFNQLEGIVDWVTQAKNKISFVLSSKKEMRDNLHHQWSSLMELEREYATVVNQLNSVATPERRLKHVQLFDE